MTSSLDPPPLPPPPAVMERIVSKRV